MLGGCVSVFELLSKKKSFALPWIGNPFLNRLGLHKARIRLSGAILKLRRLQNFSRPKHYEQFLRDGVVAIPDYLPKSVFESLKPEALQCFKAAEAETPLLTHMVSRGFGEKQALSSGFDRFDGGTLNRFLEISAERTPNCADFAKQLDLSQLYGKAAGSLAHPEKFWLYQTLHGDDQENPDDQKLTHRDTFHSAIKLWYFLEDVELEHGPLEYSVGSHRMTPERMQWEYDGSICASTIGIGRRRGGAFRASDADMAQMGFAPPIPLPVKANTLVLADIRGFHRRGHAKPGSQRHAIYANIRPHPFNPIRL